MPMLETTALDVIVAETYAMLAIVKQAGIADSEIVVTSAYGANLTPPGYCAVFVVQRGLASLRLPLARLNRKDCSRYLDAWLAFARAKKSLTNEALDAMVYGSAAWKSRDTVLWALRKKGLVTAMVH